MESYFEQYCMPEGEWQECHKREEYVSEAGIIGFRGRNRRQSKWYNHMPAVEVRDLIGQAVWDSYFKFTIIRNPFDKLISGFYMFDRAKQKPTNQGPRKRAVKRALNRVILSEKVEGESDIERFRSWIHNGGSIIDRDKYIIEGKECVDYFIRFENLNDGIQHVCERVSISFDPSMVPTFKKGARPRDIKTRDFYDQETRQIVEELYAWELQRFGYSLPE